ncbi:MAG: maltokinase N-terminal cap-like domain-containing protein [Propioniciclava sp.]
MSGTAEVHPEATLTPSKLDLLAGWLPGQSWFRGEVSDLERVAFFRFTDPDGEVGLDCMIIASAGETYHIPVSWRAEPLAEGELIGTLEHSLLGTRYCYSANTDPVYVSELIRIIREGDTAADILPAGSDQPLPATIEVRGSGVDPAADVSGQVRLVRTLGPEHEDMQGARGILSGTWTHQGAEREDILAVLR